MIGSQDTRSLISLKVEGMKMSTSGKKTFSSLESDKENGQVKQVWEITFCSF